MDHNDQKPADDDTKAVFQCYYCGYDPEEGKPPAKCPKCNGSTWERINIPDE